MYSIYRMNKSKEYADKFIKNHPGYFKEYREKNYEKLSLYYVNNKDKFFRNIECQYCGKEMLKANIKRHQKTKLCSKLSQKQEEELNQQMKNAHDLEQSLEEVEMKL